MLATFVIGLREGLEAALIVGIIAAFLRRNGKSLSAMWIGVVLSIMLSIAVGVGLHLLEQELPQSEQEALETVIGAVAIFFVTGMIVWMNGHSRQMKRELEEGAALALSKGGAYSLAIMAFLAVLKEGFETSVFLLATLSTAELARTAAFGAVLGVLVASVIGWGIYVGGVKLNLSKFFRVTGAFLVLVAAGLVVSMMRTAHEAGWLDAGQWKTFDLAWLVEPGTVRSALITGVLGIPADPRLIEMLGWLGYLIPVALYVYWPGPWRPRGLQVSRVQYGCAALLLATAVLLAAGFPKPSLPAQAALNLVASSDPAANSIGAAALTDDDEVTVALDGADARTLALTQGAATEQFRDGLTTDVWNITDTAAVPDAPTTITLHDLIALAGGRIPIGFDPKVQSGPFTIQASTVTTDTVWLAHGVLIDARESSKTIATISDGGLEAPRTITVMESDADGWQAASADVQRAASTASDFMVDEREHRFWAVLLPIALGISALLFAMAGYRTARRHRLLELSVSSAKPLSSVVSKAPVRLPADDSRTRSGTYVPR